MAEVVDEEGEAQVDSAEVVGENYCSASVQMLEPEGEHLRDQCLQHQRRLALGWELQLQERFWRTRGRPFYHSVGGFY